jgi:hypothetical protein
MMGSRPRVACLNYFYSFLFPLYKLLFHQCPASWPPAFRIQRLCGLPSTNIGYLYFVRRRKVQEISSTTKKRAVRYYFR